MGDRQIETDIVVVGGGLSGLAAAYSAARSGFEVIHLAPQTGPDRRTSALMGPSVDFLLSEGLIADAAKLGTPLKKIRIIDATNRLIRAPETLFDSAEAGLEAFAWNFPNVALLASFAEAATKTETYKSENATFSKFERQTGGLLVQTGDGREFTCKLLIGADGKSSPVRTAAGIGVREHRFDQSALVADLELARPLDGTSVEFHYPNGPFTLVPAGGDRANLVWIDKTEKLEELRRADAEAIAKAINDQSQHLFGTIKLATPTFAFPLSTLSAGVAGRDGVVLVGESAHAFPPIGAQGLNLGLRDVADLTASLCAFDKDNKDWAARLSADYADRRSSDLMRTSQMVDALFRSLLSDLLPTQTLRAGGLWALKLVPGLRRRAFAAGMGVR